MSKAKNPYEKIVQTDTISYVDKNTGEYLGGDIKRRKIVVGSPNEFIKMFLAIESVIMDLSVSEYKVFLYCCLHCSKENRISINKIVRAEIAKDYSVADSTIKGATARLTEKSLIKSIGRGAYLVNPQYVCKTDESARRKLLEYSLTIEEKA